MLRIIRNLSIGLRLQAISVIAIIGICTLSYVSIKILERSMLSDISIKTQHVVDSAVSVAAFYEQAERAGTLTREQAQEQAMKAIGAMRYDRVEYF